MVLETNESTRAGRARRRSRTQGIAATGLVAGVLVGLSGVGTALAAASAPDILRSKCGSCHLEAGKLQRITNLRKSPEGWDMTIARMGIWHKVEVSKEERKVLVKYLADRQGLAPEESATYRFLLERQPNAQDVAPNDELAQMCGRCHSYGRVALQRRDADEWGKLIHTHLGQFPSIEYSALGRDRNWRDIALGKTAGELAQRYPLQTPAWKAWQMQQARQPGSAAGSWRIAGHRPGWGDYAGYMRVNAKGGDRYDVQYELHYTAGNKVTGRGEAVLYTGYEWRGDARIGNQAVRSVFALSKDGTRLAGRWFLRESDEIGASFAAVRGDAVPRGTILSVQPALLKAGSTASIAVHGIQVGEQFDLGPGIRVLSAKAVSAHEARLQVEVAADAPAGWRAVRAAGVGAAHAEGAAGRLAIYPQLDALRVEPAFGVARVGGGSGTTAPQTAQFEAIAYLNGPDGRPGTDDDVRLGAVPATWTVDNHDEKAKAAEDVRFAGVMEPHGQFLPNFAGPNPARKGLNNVGDLKVVATVDDGGRTLTADGRLVVTVQRWNTPPLR